MTEKRPRIQPRVADHIDHVRGDVPFERFINTVLERTWRVDESVTDELRNVILALEEIKTITLDQRNIEIYAKATDACTSARDALGALGANSHFDD